MHLLILKLSLKRDRSQCLRQKNAGALVGTEIMHDDEDCDRIDDCICQKSGALAYVGQWAYMFILIVYIWRQRNNKEC